MRCIYELMNKGVKDGSATATEVKWLANQIGFHDSIIDDNHKDLCELMGIVDTIKEEVQKMVNMNQRSHCQESPARDHPMEETSVVQPVHEPGGKQQK